MNLMEMVCILFAVVFFTTIALLYNNSAFHQKQNLYNANSFVQASLLAHEVLDEVDAKLFSRSITFSQITTTYNCNRLKTLTYVNETFYLRITAVQSDSVGVPLATPLQDNIFTKVSVLVSPNAALRRPITMSRVYTKTHLNL